MGANGVSPGRRETETEQLSQIRGGGGGGGGSCTKQKLCIKEWKKINKPATKHGDIHMLINVDKSALSTSKNMKHKKHKTLQATYKANAVLAGVILEMFVLVRHPPPQVFQMPELFHQISF